MRNLGQSGRRSPVAGGLVVGVAFLGGALLGGLAMWLSLGARAPVGEPVVADRVELRQAPPPDVGAAAASAGDTAPVSATSWARDASLPRQAVIETTGKASAQAGIQADASRTWPATGPGNPTTFLQHWASLAVGLLLGGIAAGALASLWATRRAMARLKVRLGHLEQVAANGKGDWLANLDSDLVGEWQDGP